MTVEARNFRANVGALCAEHGEIQRIADKAGITRVYLSKIIHGKATPTLDVAAKVASALDMPLSLLLDSPKKLSGILARAS